MTGQALEPNKGAVLVGCCQRLTFRAVAMRAPERPRHRDLGRVALSYVTFLTLSLSRSVRRLELCGAWSAVSVMLATQWNLEGRSRRLQTSCAS